MNRLGEALNLFEQICNSKWFKQTAMILFLNKKDLFEEKLGTQPLRTFMAEYTGPDELQPAAEFIKQQFLARNSKKNPERPIYTHVTCATDTNNIKFVFDAVVNIILEENLKAVGLA